MRALRYDSFGPVASVARLTETAQPRPGPGQVLVRVQYAAINPLDRKLVEGEFKLIFKSRPPAGIGTEFSGIVEALGSGSHSAEDRHASGRLHQSDGSATGRAAGIPRCRRQDAQQIDAAASKPPAPCRWLESRRCRCAGWPT